MYTFLLVLLFIDSILLLAAILLQSGQGSGIAASFGGMTSSTNALVGTRQAGNLLTKASWWCGGIFLFLAFTLSLMSTRGRAPKSVLDQTFSGNPGAPAGTAPAAPPAGANGASNAVPLTPAPATTPTPSTTAPTGAAGGANPTKPTKP